MDFITTTAFYRSTQIVSILFLPLTVLALFYIKVEDRIVVDGAVESDNQVILRSPLDDTLLDDIFVKPGDDVAKDAPLVRFRDLQNWRQELERKQKRYELLKEKAEIYVKLHGEGAQSGLTAKDMVNESQTLEFEIAALRDKVDRLTLRAPFTGRITELMVKPYAKMEIGTPLVALSAMDVKVIRCEVPEARFPYLRKGQPVAIKSNLYHYLTFRIYTGEVKSFYTYASSASANPANGARPEPSYETKIALTGEAKELLTIGSTASCEILVEDQPLYRLFLGERKR